jgi:hypothetical protein
VLDSVMDFAMHAIDRRSIELRKEVVRACQR